jgi:uncharacterized membrane protein
MTPLIATHAFAALTSLLLGAWQLFLSPKGTPIHRLVGRVWVASMVFVSVSSFWIREIRDGQFSFLHILSVVTIVTVTLGLIDARRGRINSHVGNMRGSWIGLSVAFIFAVTVPARHIPEFMVSDPAGAAAAAVAVISTTVVLIVAGRLLVGNDAVDLQEAPLPATIGTPPPNRT